MLAKFLFIFLYGVNQCGVLVYAPYQQCYIECWPEMREHCGNSWESLIFVEIMQAFKSKSWHAWWCTYKCTCTEILSPTEFFWWSFPIPVQKNALSVKLYCAISAHIVLGHGKLTKHINKKDPRTDVALLVNSCVLMCIVSGIRWLPQPWRWFV